MWIQYQKAAGSNDLTIQLFIRNWIELIEIELLCIISFSETKSTHRGLINSMRLKNSVNDKLYPGDDVDLQEWLRD